MPEAVSEDSEKLKVFGASPAEGSPEVEMF